MSGVIKKQLGGSFPAEKGPEMVEAVCLECGGLGYVPETVSVGLHRSYLALQLGRCTHCSGDGYRWFNSYLFEPDEA